MTAPPPSPQRDPATRELARLVGAYQEASRIGHATIGTGHVLLATLADPVGRRETARAGVDLATVQSAVRADEDAVPDGRRLLHRDMGLTDEVCALLDEVGRRHAALDTDPRHGPTGVSPLLRRLLAALLTDHEDTRGGRILAAIIGADDRALLAAVLLRDTRDPA